MCWQLVSSSAKRIATQIVVIAKLNGRKDFILGGFVCNIVFPRKELPLQSKQLKHKNTSWKLKIRSKTLKRGQWSRSSVFYFNGEYISNFVPIVDFKQANICWIYIEKRNTYEDQIRYIMRYVEILYE